MIDTIFRIGLLLPNFGFLTRALKVFAAILRSRVQRRVILSTSINRPAVLIFALPKSGSTWLEGMLSSIEGYNAFMPWQASLAELKFGRSDDYRLKASHLGKTLGKASVTKVHSALNSSVMEMLSQINRPYIVLVRDIKEIIESHTHYARRTKFHPDYSILSDISIELGTKIVHNKYYQDFVQWRKTWELHHDRNKMIIDYENLLRDCESEMQKIVAHLQIEISSNEIKSIVEANRIDKLRKKSIQKDFFRGSKFN